MKKIKYKSAAHKKAALEAEQFRIERDKRLGFDSTKKVDKKKIVKEFEMKVDYRGSDSIVPSLNSNVGGKCVRGKEHKYTGTLIKGICTMHKSNAVPVIDEQQMIDISRMRRG